MKKICRRYKLWKNWCKHCSNGSMHKVLVLFGIIHSSTFECCVTCREEFDRLKMKIDRKKLSEALTLIQTYKERDIDIPDITDAASEMGEKMKQIKLAYEVGYEDGIKHERYAIKKALFLDPLDCLEKGD